jgi:hypothetical protein
MSGFKVLCVMPSAKVFAPYYQYYKNVFDELPSVQVKCLVWNRTNIGQNEGDDIAYNENASYLDGGFKKIISFYRYSRFVVDHLDKSSYDLIVVFTLAAGLFLQKKLKTSYRNRYILDIRDYSPVLRVVSIKSLIKSSVLTVISSEGFKKWLPLEHRYLLCHNVNKRLLSIAIDGMRSNGIVNKVKILCIGIIRDVNINMQFIQMLSGSKEIEIHYCGWSLEVEHLKKRIANKIHNVFFSGYYSKSEEISIVMQCDMINIVQSQTIAEFSLMSNRFYLGIICGKPMIVSKGSLHAMYVDKYNLGMVIDNNKMPSSDQIKHFLSSFDWQKFYAGIRQVKDQIQKDVHQFERQLSIVLGNNNKI